MLSNKILRFTSCKSSTLKMNSHWRYLVLKSPYLQILRTMKAYTDWATEPSPFKWQNIHLPPILLLYIGIEICQYTPLSPPCNTAWSKNEFSQPIFSQIFQSYVGKLLYRNCASQKQKFHSTFGAKFWHFQYQLVPTYNVQHYQQDVLKTASHWV